MNKKIAVALLLLTATAACTEADRTRVQSGSAPAQLPKTEMHGPADLSADKTNIRPSLASARPAAPVQRRPQYFPGTGRFVNQSARAATANISAAGEITLNFVNADVREVLKTVLGDILAANYTIDPTVQGSITLTTASPIAREMVLPTLEGALRLSGAALIADAGGGFRVLPSRDVFRAGLTVRTSGRRTTSDVGYGIEAVPLKFVSAEEMQRILEPLSPQGDIVRVDQARNLIVIAGTAQERAVMRENIATFDVNWLAGMSFALFPVHHASVKSLVSEMDQILIGQSGPAAGLIRLVPIERMNAIIGVSSRPALLQEVEFWIDKLDVDTNEAEQKIFVYFVQNGRAVDIASVLTKAITGERSQARTGNASSSLPLGALSPTTSSTVTPSTPAPTGDVSLPLSERMSDQRPMNDSVNGVNASVIGNVSITADEKNNALVILATSREYEVIEAALKRLDVMPLQVLIEAAVAEVTLTNELRYGVQYLVKEGNHQIAFSDVITGAVGAQFPGFSYLFTSGANIRAALNLLENITHVEVISAPQLMVVNNQTATLQVGDQVPVATQSAISVATPGAPIVNTIQFRDTGVILKVTPRVNEGGLVLLDIAQEVSDVAQTTSSTIDSPTIQQRKIASSVVVQDGEMLALGGLIRDRRRFDKTGIPILQDTPLIGWLFGAKDTGKSRTELVIFITPRVIRNSMEARQISNEVRQRLSAAAPLLP